MGQQTDVARIPRIVEGSPVVDAAIERAESLMALRKAREEFTRQYKTVEAFRRDVLYPAIVRAEKARSALAALERIAAGG